MRRGHAFAVRLGLGIALVPGMPLAAVPDAAAQTPAVAEAVAQAPRLEGEYGLSVRESRDTLEVRWLTAAATPGWVRVLVDGAVHHEGETPSAGAHAVRVARPEGDAVVLEYGSATDPQDRHRTELRLEVPPRGPTSVEGVDSIFVLGDVHGEFDALRAVLRNAGVVDEAGRWAGGRGHLVFLGDLTDRGPDVTRVLWYVYGLEREAEQAGGRVHVVLGNHELMVMSGDLRYVHPKELLLATRHDVPYPWLFDPQHSILGRWLAAKPGLIRIDRALFAHGGVSADQLNESLRSIDDSLAAFVGEELFRRWWDTTYAPAMAPAELARRNDFFWGERSVFWYRGYLQADTLGLTLDRVLRRFRADVLVVGHTAVSDIQERYDGALIAAHPRTPAAELLLLVRSPRGYERLRYGPTGPPRPILRMQVGRRGG